MHDNAPIFKNDPLLPLHANKTRPSTLDIYIPYPIFYILYIMSLLLHSCQHSFNKKIPVCSFFYLSNFCPSSINQVSIEYISWLQFHKTFFTLSFVAYIHWNVYELLTCKIRLFSCATVHQHMEQLNSPKGTYQIHHYFIAHTPFRRHIS